MSILDFFGGNPAQLQQLALTADPGPVLAQLNQVTGQHGSYGIADLISPQQPQLPLPIPYDPAAVAQLAPMISTPMGPPQELYPAQAATAAPQSNTAAKEEEQKKKLAAANRSAELAAAMTTERPQAVSAGTPAGGGRVGQMTPIFSPTGAQAPISLAQLLSGGR